MSRFDYSASSVCDQCMYLYSVEFGVVYCEAIDVLDESPHEGRSQKLERAPVLETNSKCTSDEKLRNFQKCMS